MKRTPKIIPVLHLGPRTQHAAHMFIHSLRHLLVPGCLPLFTSDGLNVYFSALTAHFGHWLAGSRRGRKARQWQVAASLIYGQMKKSYRRRKLVRVTHVMRLGTQAALTVARPRTGSHGSTQHCFYRASESDRPPWGGSAGTPHMGHGPASLTTAGPFGMVASLLSFRASSRITTGGARAAARAGWQTSGTTLPATNRSSGSGKNQPALDSAGSAVLSPASSVMLHNVSVNEVRRRPVRWQ